MEAAEAPPAKEYGVKKGSSLYHPPTNEEMQSASRSWVSDRVFSRLPQADLFYLGS